MTRDDDDAPSLQRWAQFRFSVVGPLLASPPVAGELYAEIERLSQKIWRHPITGESTTFAFSTIERWYYASRTVPDPVSALLRKRRRDSGVQSAVSEKVEAVLRGQYRDSPYWSYTLHRDNLAVVIQAHPELGSLPSYSSLRRFMVFITDAGELIEKRIRTERERLIELFKNRPKAKILMESSTISEWVARLLEELGHDVIVADPNYAPMYVQRSRRV